MMKSPLRILPLFINSWDAGHELPDVVGGRLFSRYIFVRLENRGAEVLRGIVLRVEGSPFVKETHGTPITLQPGQRGSAHAELIQSTDVTETACPLRLRLLVEAEGLTALTTEPRLRCREMHDRFTFVYLDVDESPQIAAAKFPAALPGTNETGCTAGRGCAVLLSTHGMDVTAQRQADCYRPKRDAWVLAPHGRGTHGFNWQGPGEWSALRALDALAERAARWPVKEGGSSVALSTPRRVLFTGHSNGGYGAWFFGVHHPDLAVGVAPLSGMATMGTTEVARPPGVPTRLWELIHSSVEEYRGDRVAANLLGVPFMARTGAQDRVIDPRSTHRMAALLQQAGLTFGRGESTSQGSEWRAVNGDATIVELRDKEHWWWDTLEANDGGAMDDEQLRAFFSRTLSDGTTSTSRQPAANLDGEHGVRFTCAALASCGSRLGIRMLLPLRPFSKVLPAFHVRRRGRDGGLRLSTENVGRLRIETTMLSEGSLSDGSSSLLVDVTVDGQRLALPRTSPAGEGAGTVLCRDADGASGTASGWQLCGDEGTCAATDAAWTLPRCCAPPARSAEVAAGPIRRVLSRPFTCIYGTRAASGKATDAYRKAAISFANAWALVGGGVTAVLADKDAPTPLPAERNWILFGGPSTNRVAHALAPTQPVQPVQPPAQSEGEGKPSGRLEAGFRVGGCSFTAKGSGLVALGPANHRGGLVVTVAGTTLSGFQNAVESFRSNLFDVNSWQHRLPDFVVIGPQYVKRKRSQQEGVAHNPLRGMLAAGYLGSEWDFREDAAYLDCG